MCAKIWRLKPRERLAQNAMKAMNESAMRASISFPRDLYRSLEELAKQKKVSLAWIVRDAAEQYLTHHKQNKDQR
jgi:metal-responsive CopG/Arc/MetJ family transcriptional regulator